MLKDATGATIATGGAFTNSISHAFCIEAADLCSNGEQDPGEDDVIVAEVVHHALVLKNVLRMKTLPQVGKDVYENIQNIQSSATIANGQNISFSASTSIQLNANFAVEQGGVLQPL